MDIVHELNSVGYGCISRRLLLLLLNCPKPRCLLYRNTFRSNSCEIFLKICQYVFKSKLIMRYRNRWNKTIQKTQIKTTPLFYHACASKPQPDKILPLRCSLRCAPHSNIKLTEDSLTGTFRAPSMNNQPI